MQLKPNSLLQGGKYRIEKVLGQGGFGITYQAVQVALNRKVAIKEFFMKEYCNRDSETSHVSVPSEGSKELVGKFRQKFIKEAQNIAALNHPHIIRIHDVFEENGTAYYVMEHINNGSLSDLVKERGQLNEAEAMRYIRQVADALGYIHQRNMNHLDIKPGNILLDEEGNAVLIDFGLSKRYDKEGNQTSTTPVGISHGYAPLEQYKKGGVGTFSPATDIYSLGATLYKLLTGVTPPEANDVMDDGLPALPTFVAAATASAIEKAMQPIRKNRPQSVAEFMALLSGEDDETGTVVDEHTDLVQEPVSSSVRKTQPVSASAAHPQSSSPSSSVPSSSSSFWKKWVLPVAACLLAALVVICWPNSGTDSGGGDEPVVDSLNVQGISQEQQPAKEENTTLTTQTSPVAEANIPSPSLLYVTTSPTGATVYVDGKKVGITPIEGKEVSQGRHTVKITKDGYESFSEKKQFGDKPMVLNETLEAEVKDVPVAQPTTSQPTTSRFSSTGTHNGYTYVDLGLSVRWADCNVGASSPSDYGDYFAWGETSPKSSYNDENCVTWGKNIGDISGNSQYDVARAIWGGSWRLPTKKELEELNTKCQWKWTTQGGHYGYKVIGPNGNSIFLPAAGFWLNSPHTDGKETGTYYGYYRGSTPYSSYLAYSLVFDSRSRSHTVYEERHSTGYSVRPVSD